MLLELPAGSLEPLLDDWLPEEGLLCEDELLEDEELLEGMELLLEGMELLLEGIWADGGWLLDEVVLQPLNGASSTTASSPSGARCFTVNTCRNR